MKLVVQRVKSASVLIDSKKEKKITNGLVVFLGFCKNDTDNNINFYINKLINLRIFEKDGKMNLSVKDVNGSILSISQFTLYGDASKGNRPSYIKALRGEESEPLYNLFNKKLNEIVPTYSGIFGADMKIEILNDGPCTIIIESKK